jgi:hypothetical protein
MDVTNKLIQQASAQMGESGDILTNIKLYIEGQFGTPGLIAAGLLLAGIVGLILSKTLKLSFDIVRYVAVPSVAITFIATYFLPFSFVYILPVTVAFFSIVLLVKG